MAEKELSFKETVNKFNSLVSRRRWWVVGTGVVIALGTIAYTLRLPNRFESEAVLAFTPQDVSQTILQIGNVTPVTEQVESMKREILSRNQLLGIIRDFDLYPKLRPKFTDDEMADRMRSDVTVKSLELMDGRPDTNAFAISFAADSAQLAQSVTSRLTSLFITEDLKKRGEQAVTTSNFLGEQLRAAQNKLLSQEARLEQFKRQNITELPEQQTSNMGIVTDLRLQLQTSMNNLARARQDRASLESQLAGKVAALNAERAALLTRYTAKHYEVIRKDQEIAKTQSILDSVRSGAPLSDTGDAVTAALVNQASANRVEIENLIKEQQRINSDIAQYQNRVNGAPIREQQLAQLTREYEVYKKDYEDLETKSAQSNLETGVTMHHEGARFHLIDQASLPTKPSSPQRLKISLVGLAAGLLLGLCLGLVRDMRDNTFHEESVLKDRFTLPLVVGIPSVLTPHEAQSKSARRTLELIAMTAMVLIVFASEFFIYRRG